MRARLVIPVLLGALLAACASRVEEEVPGGAVHRTEVRELEDLEIRNGSAEEAHVFFRVD